MRLADKVALVTGGSRGQGRAIALGFAREGADLAVGYHTNEREAQAAVDEIRAMGRRAIAVRADTSDSAQVAAMVESVMREFDRVDILVNCAGVMKRTPFLEIAEDEWDWLLGVNLKGYFLVGQAVAREMVKRKQGAIINISSAAQQIAAPNMAHYGSSKGGVAQLTRQMALELVGHGIRVNAICPGAVETDMNRKDFANPEFRKARLATIPMKVLGQPEDVVGTAIYLACDDSRLVIGAHIFVDAGQTIV